MHDPQEPQTGTAGDAAGAEGQAATPQAESPPAGGAPDGAAAGGGGEAERTTQAPVQPEVEADTGGAGERGGGGDDAQPAAPPAATVAGEQNNEDADDDIEEDEEDLDEDPRLTAARPAFTHDDAFCAAAEGAYGVWTEESEALRPLLVAVFMRVRKGGAMAVETAWRTMQAAGGKLPDWSDRQIDQEVRLTAFVAVAAALITIADAQQRAFEKVEAELKAEAHQGRMRKGMADRRAKKAERMKKRPEAVRRYLANQQRNRAARDGGNQVFVEPVKPAGPPKKPVERDGHGDAISRTRGGGRKRSGKGKGAK